MPYEFTPANPPLFKKGHHEGDVFSIEAHRLEKTVGVAKWMESKEWHDSGRGFRAPSTLTEYHYIATRKWRWSVEPPVVHYTNDVTEAITIVTGYSLRQKQSIEKNFGLKFGTSGPASMFSAEVSASLKLTEETERTWKEEVSVKREQTFSKGYTYVNWILRDVILIERLYRVRRLDGRGGWLRTDNTVEQISCSLTFFPDKFAPVASATLRSAPLVPLGSSPIYNAVCSEIHNGSLGWMGEDRLTREEAQRDCRDHCERFPGHDCIVLDY